jgi:hypothetical protein
VHESRNCHYNAGEDNQPAGQPVQPVDQIDGVDKQQKPEDRDRVTAVRIKLEADASDQKTIDCCAAHKGACCRQDLNQ